MLSGYGDVRVHEVGHPIAGSGGILANKYCDEGCYGSYAGARRLNVCAFQVVDSWKLPCFKTADSATLSAALPQAAGFIRVLGWSTVTPSNSSYEMRCCAGESNCTGRHS